MVRSGREGSGIRPAVSFAFDLRFSTLKKWEQDAQRQKKRGGECDPSGLSLPGVEVLLACSSGYSIVS